MHRIKKVKHKIKTLIPNSILGLLVKSSYVRQFTGYGYFGLGKIDREIAKYVPKRNGYYVELGANDGIKQSNSLHFEKFRNYRGLLVEPYTPNFELCVANRSKINEFRNAACVSFDFSEPFIEMIYSDLMTTPNEGFSDISDREGHAKSGVKFLGAQQTFKFLAPAVSLNSILLEINAPERIDFLSLDVEGGEIEVLKGIDHGRFRFTLLCVESRDYDSLHSYLSSYSYQFERKISMHDYLFLDMKSNMDIGKK